MKSLRQIAMRLRGVIAGRRAEAELDEEVQLHLAMLSAEHRGRGLSAEAAALAARRDFGGVAQMTERYREQRGLPFFDTLAQDVRYAIRLWRRAPGFAMVVIAVLALGIGANSAMFTLVDTLLFRPLPGRAGQLVGVYSHDPSVANSYRLFSYPNFVDIRDRSGLFDHVIAFTAMTVGVPQGNTVRRTFVEAVSSNYFAALDVPLVAGRTFTIDEERPGGGATVAIANYQMWQAAGFDPSLIGRTIRLNTHDFTIVGIAPKGFTGTNALLARELWVPLGAFDSLAHDAIINNGRGLTDRSNSALWVAVLLKPGVTRNQVDERLAVLSRDLQREYAAENRGQVLSVHTMSRVNRSSTPSDDTGPAVLSAVLMPLSGAVLLIACLNIANMMLARGTVRKREIAVRVALGGGRRRLVRQLLTESLVLALIGASLGVTAGWWAVSHLASSLQPILPIPLQFDTRPDGNVLVVSALFAVGSAVAFGLAPALRMSRADVVDDLRDAGARGSSRSGARSWLVVCQIAVSLMLMVAGALFARGALQASVANPGYRYDGLLLATIDPSLAGFSEEHGREQLQAALDRLRRLPGVAAVSANSQVPFGDYHMSHPVVRTGHTDPGSREPTYTLITPGYFSSVGLPILRGRDFTLGEAFARSAAHVAIIDEPLAKRLFPDEDPLGHQVSIPVRGSRVATPANEPMTIVGLVPGVRDELTERQPAAHLYVPWTTSRSTAPINIHLRAEHGSGAELLEPTRRALLAVDSRLPIMELRTMQEVHDRGLVLWVIRTAGRTLIGLGLLALLLAAIGVYGVKSYVVSQRTREIGIRIALGARPREIGMMLLRDGARTTLMGVAIGFPLAVLLGQFLSVAIFEVSSFDPIALTVAPIVLASVTAVATYIPARRGMRVSPLEALRTE